MEYIFLIVIFILAGIVPELTGFGAAAVSMALLPFFLPISIVIPLVAITSTITTGIISFQIKTKGLWKYIIPLVVGSIIGVPLGMYFLHLVDESILKLSLGLFLIIYGLYGLFQKTAFLPESKIFSVIIGTVAGFFSASFNINGPLVGAYTTSNKNLNINENKDIIATYLFIAGIFTIVGHLLAGRITLETISLLSYAIPSLLIGLIIGTKILNKLEGTLAKRIIYSFILISGIILII